LDPFDLGAGRRAAADELALVIEGLVAHGVPTGEAAEIDLAAPLQLLPQRLHALEMARLGGAEEARVADGHHARHVAEVLRHAIAERLRVDARGARRLLHLLAVL